MQSKSNIHPLLIYIVGPTAVGKTEVSIELASRFGGEIISGDSRTFYKKMNIGTAKPTMNERKKIPHHLIDVSNLDETWSVAKFQKESLRLIDLIHLKGKIPFLVGGTGQYIKSIVEGWEIPPQTINSNMREILLNWANEINPYELHKRLSVVDPDAALIIDPRNVRRTIRALEVIFLTGKRFSAQRRKSTPPFQNLIIGLNRSRQELYDRIDTRLDKMLASGWIAEVKQLLDLDYCPDLPAFSAIGYREIIDMLAGKISSEEALLMMKKRTRELVRRQANWFKNSDARINWFIVKDGVVDDISRLINLHVNLTNHAGEYGGEYLMNKPWLKSYDDAVPTTISYPDIPLFNFLDEMARKFPDRPCTTFQNHQISYQEMHKLVNIFASSLTALGVGKGDRVGLMMANLPQFVMSFYAILKVGAVVVAINPYYKERELKFQLGDSGCKILIGMRERYGLIQKIRSETPLEAVILTEIGDSNEMQNLLKQDCTKTNYGEIAEGDHRLLTLLNKYRQNPIAGVQVLSDSEAIFQYSGGTTGIPKAAIGLHKNLVANTLQFRKWLIDLEEGKEVVLVAIPLYHVYGMVIAMSMGIALAANLVLIPDARNVDDILLNIDQYKATMFPGVPTMYQAINKNPEVQAGHYNLRSIKACISGSAPLLADVKLEFEKLTGGKLLEGYGLSEAPTATHCNPLYGENRIGSIGLPLPDVNCRIVSLEEDGKDLPPNTAGELLICGPQIMKGYHNMPEETALTLENGWLHTGDIAKMDSDGFFYLVDRKKDVIKPGGFQVWPREIEEIISSHPSVNEVAVAGVMHPQKGEIARAWIVRIEGNQITEQEIAAWCSLYLANYKVPGEIEFIEHLPRTNVGKILRRELVREYQAREG